ncbi:MAG: aldo/keto reductase [Dehalococcoidia bacterium]|jgi:predicted aldo/keto reductase-like oxidoreductase
MEQRAYGKTGEKFSILSFGAQRIVDSHGCSEDEAIRMVNYALDHGIRYFDTAWIYSAGQSEERVGKVAKSRRSEMWLVTKVWARDKKGARTQLEQSLKRLQTDHVDEWRLHNVWSIEELDKLTGPGGALETAIQARTEGLTRNISISGHSNPRVQVEALERFPFDSVLCSTSVLDHFVLSFAEEFIPVAKAKGAAVAGMKIIGLGILAHLYEKAMRYSFGLPIDTAVIGMENMEQLKNNLAVAEKYKPLTDEERLELFKEVLPLVSPQNAPWKAENWTNPVMWKKR